jgi:hypothetical protein
VARRTRHVGAVVASSQTADPPTHSHSHFQADPKLTTPAPATPGLPNNAIAARYDLPVAPTASGPAAANWTRHPYGAVDAKLTTSRLLAARRQLVVAGPTTAGGLPAFDWADPAFEGTPHEGCVRKYDFPWVEVRPRLASEPMRRAGWGWGWGLLRKTGS